MSYDVRFSTSNCTLMVQNLKEPGVFLLCGIGSGMC